MTPRRARPPAERRGGKNFCFCEVAGKFPENPKAAYGETHLPFPRFSDDSVAARNFREFLGISPKTHMGFHQVFPGIMGAKETPWGAMMRPGSAHWGPRGARKIPWGAQMPAESAQWAPRDFP